MHSDTTINSQKQIFYLLLFHSYFIESKRLWFKAHLSQYSKVTLGTKWLSMNRLYSTRKINQVSSIIFVDTWALFWKTEHKNKAIFYSHDQMWVKEWEWEFPLLFVFYLYFTIGSLCETYFFTLLLSKITTHLIISPISKDQNPRVKKKTKQKEYGYTLPAYMFPCVKFCHLWFCMNPEVFAWGICSFGIVYSLLWSHWY